MDEALVEHAGAKELIEQLEDADPADGLYDAKVTVLGEQIDHHVKEEEGDMFPKAKKAKVDTEALGATMLKRKITLMKKMGETTQKPPNRRAPQKLKEEQCPARDGPDICAAPRLEGPPDPGQTGALSRGLLSSRANSPKVSFAP